MLKGLPVVKDRKYRKRKPKVVPDYYPLAFAPASKTTWDSGYPDPQKKSSGKKSKKRKVRELHEPWTDGQPRFEGGIRWEQGGLPGLGKRR
jgi:hypothetical protein